MIARDRTTDPPNTGQGSEIGVTGGEVAILVAGGLAAGVVNTLAGGGSLISVPLLVLVGLPATTANGTNRIGVFFQNLIAAWSFRARGVSGLAGASKVVLPVCIGSLIGAYTVAKLDDATFQRIFGLVMLIDLIPMLRKTKPGGEHATRPWPRWLLFSVFTLIGALRRRDPGRRRAADGRRPQPHRLRPGARQQHQGRHQRGAHRLRDPDLRVRRPGLVAARRRARDRLRDRRRARREDRRDAAASA